MGNSASDMYNFTMYYIHWFTDRDYINTISILNDDLVKRFNRPLTYTKSMQLYDALGTVKSNASLYITRDILGGPVISILVDGQLTISFSLCTCCPDMGIIEDKRQRNRYMGPLRMGPLRAP
jgi:hypothetical protein